MNGLKNTLRGESQGMKKEENGETLAGAIIGLFLTDGTESLSWPPFPQRTAAFP